MTSTASSPLRSMTVLVCDMVGSTDMRVRLGADGERLFHLHERLAREAVAAHNGTFVKALGDGAMAVFDAASDAVASAVLLQRQIDGLHRHGEAQDLTVRIGVSAGDVSVSKDDCHGLPVAESFRLCNAAAADEVLVADVVRVLARRLTVGLSPAGDLELRGLVEPVTAWRVDWRTHTEDWSTIPLPTRLALRGDSMLVGRDLEVEKLLAPARIALGGETSPLLLLAGEPGVGKSALAREAALRLHDAGALVMHGGCDDELRPPYQPFVQALRHLVRHAPTTVLVDYIHRYGGDLGLLVPELADRIGRLPEPRSTAEAADRYLLFAAVAGLLECALRDVPLVLVLDDLHWADRGTILLLKHLLVGADLRGLVVIATFRDTEPDDDSGLQDLVAQLHRVEGVHRLDLTGLPGDEVRNLVAAMLPADDSVVAAVAHAVHQETDGNPFFVTELVRHVLETGASDAADPLPPLPVSVRDVVRQRVRRMGGNAQTVLAAAAVLGAEFQLQVLTELVDLTPDATLDVLERAVDSAVLREVPGRSSFRFVHALLQHTLYQDLSETRRRRSHALAAQVLEAQLDTQPTSAATHWLAAGDMADPARVRPACTAAAQEALRQRAPDQAARWFSAALDTEPADDERCRLMVRLGDAQRLAGDPRHHQTLLEAGAFAQAIGDAQAQAEAALANSRWFSSSVGSGDPAQLALLRAALQAIGTDPSPTRARLLATMTGELVYGEHPADRYAAADEALAVARAVGDELTLFDVLFWRSTSARPVDGSWRDDELAELTAIAERGSDPLRLAMAHMVAVMRGLHVGDIEGGEFALSRAEVLADELGLPILRWLVSIVRATHIVLSGSLDQGEKVVHEAFELSQMTDQPDALAWYGVQIYMIRYQEGRLGELVDLLSAATAAAPKLHSWHMSLAMAYTELDRRDDAAAIIDQIMATDYPNHPEEPHWLVGMSCLGSSLAATRHDVDAMNRVYDALLPMADLWASIMPLSLGSQERVLGELALALGHHDTALAHFTRAVASNEAGPAPTFAARCRVGVINSLRAAGTPVDDPAIVELADLVRAECAHHGLARVLTLLDLALAAG